ncbi:hypothetical protein I6E26_00440 [Anaerovibrio lipolyticus]|uniref:hypothetical protein n=1 Tax=Anaerovibrio lipolyticus TaxID=82374 RepID=UPI001F28E261|nr:hypothetical protein [Anaerovibrio lipolyticus]MCF2600025.1 hypothetical protein [Anaerovibrio lipolyticus]
MASEMKNGQSGITITSVKGEKIVLTSTNTKIKFDTLDYEKVRDKSKAVIATVIITGKIKGTDISELKKVFNWSKSFKSDEVYRKLVVEYTKGTDEIRRSYEFSEMFVLNYEEYLTEAGTDSQYTLTLRQKEDHLDDIKTY